MLSMMRGFAFALLLGIAAAPTASAALEPVRPGQDAFITRAVYASGRLWLLTDAGILSSLAPGEAHRTVEAVSQPVFDICSRGDTVVAVTGARDKSGPWTIRRSPDWSVVATVPRGGDGSAAMLCSGSSIQVLTARRLLSVTAASTKALDLIGTLGPGNIASILATPASIYVGFDAGEWGGGLRRIDRSTGKISVVASNASGGLCGGPLNTDCDPVNGLAAMPGRPGCIAAAIGLVHFASHGRIDVICGDRVRELYVKPLGGQPPGTPPRGMDPYITVAFYSLIASGETLWSAGVDGIYAIDASGKARKTPIPAFQTVDGVAVSFALPHLVVVVTEAGRRNSVSTGAPLLVAR